MHNEEQTIKALLQVNQEELNDQVVQTVDARSLHQFLGIKTPFTTWIGRQIEDFDFRLGVDFLSFLEETITL